MSGRTLTQHALAAETGADVGRGEAVRSFLAAGVTLGHIQADIENRALTIPIDGSVASRSVETASNTPLLLIVLGFLSSACAPAESHPVGLRWFAEHQPFTPMIEGIRGLLDGTPDASTALLALAWCAALSLAGYLWARHLYQREPRGCGRVTAAVGAHHPTLRVMQGRGRCPTSPRRPRPASATHPPAGPEVAGNPCRQTRHGPCAPRSSDSTIQVGKSTFTRRCSCSGRRAASASRCALMSSPASNFSSNSLAFMEGHLLCSRPTHRADPDPAAAVNRPDNAFSALGVSAAEAEALRG